MKTIGFLLIALSIVFMAITVIFVIKAINYYKDRDVEFEFKYSEKKKEDKNKK